MVSGEVIKSCLYGEKSKGTIRVRVINFPHLCLPAVLCIGQTGTERPLRSRAHQWMVKIAR